MSYTWTTQIHSASGARSNIQVELWVRMAHDWVNIDIVRVDTLDKAQEVARSIRSNHAFLERFQAPMIIAVVQFAARDHYRLVTWYGTYSEGNIDA